MRTTLNIDPDIINVARKLAMAREQSLGQVISELARRGLQRSSATIRARSGFPVFDVDRKSTPITLEDVKRDEDEA